MHTKLQPVHSSAAAAAASAAAAAPHWHARHAAEPARQSSSPPPLNPLPAPARLPGTHRGRAPFLLHDEQGRKALADAGFLYDSSIPDNTPSNISPSLEERSWPYRMDQGIPQSCDTGGWRLAGTTGLCSSSVQASTGARIPRQHVACARCQPPSWAGRMAGSRAVA